MKKYNYTSKYRYLSYPSIYNKAKIRVYNEKLESKYPT